MTMFRSVLLASSLLAVAGCTQEAQTAGSCSVEQLADGGARITCDDGSEATVAGPNHDHDDAYLPVEAAETFVEEGTILTAVVNADGELVSGRHATSASADMTTGHYYVVFDRSVAGCARVGTTGNLGKGTTTGIVANTELAISDATDKTVFVITRLGYDDNALAALPFHLMIICD